MDLIGTNLKRTGDMNYIKMTFKSASDWSGPEKASEFADILVSQNSFFLPQKYDRYQPEHFVFNPNDLTKFIEIWTSETGGLITNRKKPYLAWMMLDWCYRESQRFNEFMSGFDERYFKNEDNVTKLLSCAKRLYNWGTITQGYICHARDWESKNRYGRITEDAKGRPSAGGGNRLDEGLPGIYWANFFGPVYVDFFGKEKFKTVAAYHKEELSDGGFVLLTAASPFDYNKPEVHVLEEKIIDHLGREAFFEKAHPKKLCKTPPFTFEQKELGRPIEVIAYDPVSEAIPDPYRFIQEASKLAESLRERFDDKLDYSPKSLDKVDDFILKKSYRKQKPWTNEKGRQLIQELTAYYGELLRRNLQGKWLAREIEKKIIHPAVVFILRKQEEDEYPFARVMKLWSERERADGLSIRYHLLASGELRKVARYFSRFLR